jgi:predicted nuclease with TOPRIM domain
VKQFCELTKRFSELTKQLCELAKRFCELAKQFCEIAKQFCEIAERFCELAKRLSEIAEQLSEIRKRLSELAKGFLVLTKQFDEKAEGPAELTKWQRIIPIKPPAAYGQGAGVVAELRGAAGLVTTVKSVEFVLVSTQLSVLRADLVALSAPVAVPSAQLAEP